MSEGHGAALIPISDEQAKALQEAFKLGQTSLETVRKFGGWFAKVLGSAPEDLVGLLVGDRIRAARFENMVRLGKRSQERLDARHVIEPEPAALSIALPLLEHASDESREELVELWARLLAAALDPARSRRVRQTFIDAIKAMDPVDALVLLEVNKHPNPQVGNQAHITYAEKLGVTPEEADISLHRLAELNCVRDRDARGYDPKIFISRAVLTSFGTELVRVLSD